MAIIIDGKSLERQDYLNEDELQEKIFEFPELLSNDDNLDIFSIMREVNLPYAGKLDILLMDELGQIIAVEVKLNRNIQSRREVIAQIFDYISDLSNLTFYELDNIVKNKLSEKIDTIDEENKLPKAVDSFLKTGRIRLIIAVDETNEDLKRIMTFISTRTDLDVKLIEIAKYNNGKILIPNIIVDNKNTDIAVNRSKNEVINQDLINVVEYYNKLETTKYKAIGSGNRYRQVKVMGWPNPLHYEFIIRGNNNIGVEFHLESSKYEKLNERLKEFDSKQIGDYKITFSYSNKGNGRLTIRISLSDGVEKISLCMQYLIELTIDKFDKAIKEIVK